MVRRGSTVRVRQRASQKASKSPFCCLGAVRPALERPPSCPQDLSPTFELEHLLGLNSGIGDHRAPPWKGGGLIEREAGLRPRAVRELRPRLDAELAESLAQVMLDRTRRPIRRVSSLLPVPGPKPYQYFLERLQR